MGETFDDTQIGAYQEGRVDFHNDRRISLQNGARMPILYPGEDVKAVNAARPHSNFEVFESAALRNIAAATGLSTQQVTQDWSDVNYSSARSAMLEARKTLTRRRDDFSVGFAQPILSAFIEEIHDTEDLPLPSGAPHFLDARAAYCRARWMGPVVAGWTRWRRRKAPFWVWMPDFQRWKWNRRKTPARTGKKCWTSVRVRLPPSKSGGSRFRAGHRLKSTAPETIRDPEAE